MARCYRLQSERNIAGGLSINRHFVLSYMCNVLSRSRLLEGSLLRKIALLLEINRGISLRETQTTQSLRPLQFPANDFFAHAFRTSMLLIPLDSTKTYNYRYTTSRQTRRFITTADLTISSSERNHTNRRKKKIYMRGTESHDFVVFMACRGNHYRRNSSLNYQHGILRLTSETWVYDFRSD